MKQSSIATINRLARKYSRGNVDLSKPITDEVFKDIHDLLDAHRESLPDTCLSGPEFI